MERTIYNTLFAAQSPDGRRIRYFTPMEGDRVYHQGDTYCCPGNFRRIIAELPNMIYYHAGTGVAVNLYTPSQTTIDLGNKHSLTIRQETDYPTSGHVAIRLDPSKPAKFLLQLRIPKWCGSATVAINGQRLESPIRAGAFLSLDREWKAGDQVVLELPMAYRLVLGRKRQAGRVAVMRRGPLVFCLNPDQNKSLRYKDVADLNDIMIDPDSLKDLAGDNTVHPGGMACMLRAGRDGFEVGVTGNVPLKLTEFADPQGKKRLFSSAGSECIGFRRACLRSW